MTFVVYKKMLVITIKQHIFLVPMSKYILSPINISQNLLIIPPTNVKMSQNVSFSPIQNKSWLYTIVYFFTI